MIWRFALNLQSWRRQLEQGVVYLNFAKLVYMCALCARVPCIYVSVWLYDYVCVCLFMSSFFYALFRRLLFLYLIGATTLSSFPSISKAHAYAVPAAIRKNTILYLSIFYNQLDGPSMLKVVLHYKICPLIPRPVEDQRRFVGNIPWNIHYLHPVQLYLYCCWFIS